MAILVVLPRLPLLVPLLVASLPPLVVDASLSSLAAVVVAQGELQSSC